MIATTNSIATTILPFTYADVLGWIFTAFIGVCCFAFTYYVLKATILDHESSDADYDENDNDNDDGVFEYPETYRSECITFKCARLKAESQLWTDMAYVSKQEDPILISVLRHEISELFQAAIFHSLDTLNAFQQHSEHSKVLDTTEKDPEQIQDAQRSFDSITYTHGEYYKASSVIAVKNTDGSLSYYEPVDVAEFQRLCYFRDTGIIAPAEWEWKEA